MAGRYAREAATAVRSQLPYVALVFLGVYAGVALFELHAHPERTAAYLWLYAVEAVCCGAALVLVRRPDAAPRRYLAVAIALAVALISATTLYHVVTRGEAEVLALAVVYLTIGFLVAVPWGAWAQLAVAAAAGLALVVGLAAGARNAIDAGILATGTFALGGLSVLAAGVLDRYRFKLFLAQEHLTAAKEAAEAASHARRDFVASVSHDLRTPVNIIYGMADMALDTAVSADQREFVETIKRAAGQLHALMNDLLDFSKMDAGRVDLAPRPFAVRPWLDGTLDAHAGEARAKGVWLAGEVGPQVPHAMIGDPDRLRQVLGNLVGNAVKFTDHGGVTVRITAAGNGTGPDALRVAVADTGIGIPPEEFPRLFQPFSQAASTSNTYGGTGLGLAICKRLVELMGGRIGVESEPGRGSTFWFTVPLSRAGGEERSASG